MVFKISFTTKKIMWYYINGKIQKQVGLTLKKYLSFFCIFILCSTHFFAEHFTYKYSQGETFRVLSTINERVYFNGRYQHTSNITNRITLKTTEIYEDGSAKQEATFVTSEDIHLHNAYKPLQWGKEYQSTFIKSALGQYTIAEEYFMPVVRDVPVFLNKDIQVGESWLFEGHEAHDLRDSFGVEKPYLIPFTAQYTYEGLTDFQGKKLHSIKVIYRLEYQHPSLATTHKDAEYPIKTKGYSNQRILFDNENGRIETYSEDFRIILETNFGNKHEVRGFAKSEIEKIEHFATKEQVAALEKEIEQLQLKDISVDINEHGLTIQLENIQFEPESAYLRESEKEKLRLIGQLLKPFDSNDILVAGHTALSGSKESQLSLSQERALAVAEFMISSGIKPKEKIFTQGFGAEKPLADNSTPEGMKKNRRVEITILEK
ncbi:MAG: OmpA family protein [Spirochaetaceae bacterium]|nr:OmpA family protein [Spirochaetaceae bacterium]